jgi:hypothetical protein
MPPKSTVIVSSTRRTSSAPKLEMLLKLVIVSLLAKAGKDTKSSAKENTWSHKRFILISIEA